jgi:hypothetical protein
MTVVDSRVKNGTLTIDAVAFTGQAFNVQLVPSFAEEGDRLELLSGEVLEPEDVTSWSLNFSAVQDFDNEEGWIEFARASDGEVVPFTFKPNNSATAPTYSGTAKVRAVAIGGPTNQRLTSDAAWPVKTGPTPAYPEP